MGPLGNAGLTAANRAVVEGALRRDPALARELAEIDAALAPAARARFWPLLAALLAERRERPAAAVLAALEAVALGRRGRGKGGARGAGGI